MMKVLSIITVTVAVTHGKCSEYLCTCVFTYFAYLAIELIHRLLVHRRKPIHSNSKHLWTVLPLLHLYCVSWEIPIYSRPNSLFWRSSAVCTGQRRRTSLTSSSGSLGLRSSSLSAIIITDRASYTAVDCLLSTIELFRLLVSVSGTKYHATFCIRYDLYCVEWSFKFYSLTHPITSATSLRLFFSRFEDSSFYLFSSSLTIADFRQCLFSD